MAVSPNILVIDDDEPIRDSCQQTLSKAGCRVKTAKEGNEGLLLFKEEAFDVILLDLKMPGRSGVEILEQIKEDNPETIVIIMTGYPSVETAIQTMKMGAYDYISKPFTPEELRINVRRALEKRDLVLENIYLKRQHEEELESDIIGQSEGMQKVLQLARKVGPTESTVLITGESGTGKELIAKAIRNYSNRKDKPFITVDCGSLVESLFESELFGHVKGSFTGATATKHGRFELANGGTIFFDEIANISTNIQAKLLRAIQEGEVTKVGSNQVIKVDVRIIAATNQDLKHLVNEERFREDLFYRLSVVPIHLPSLRERPEDIPVLAMHFLREYSQKRKKTVGSISEKAMKALMQYSWPGNVRELENAIERAVVLTEGNVIQPVDLLYHELSTAREVSHGEERPRSLEDVEKEYISQTLETYNGHRSKTAQSLGINRKTLWRKMKKYGLE
ncbi:MAG: sigma-54-dependent Fis family transcriptional regulator [Fidelibacterota bacterium]|nr:MAG: sigma-54-dependent Fis family transcriptional regulator [Candidatus Neomarinimicrobiota bacterium]